MANYGYLRVIGSIALIASAPAFAENWIEVGRGEGGDTYYYDAASVVKDGSDRVKYSGKVEFASAASIKNAIKLRRSLGLETKGYSRLKLSFALEEIDCKLRKVRNLSGMAVDRNGKVLDQHRAEGPWGDIRPGTAHDRFHNLLCR